ncbi:hypothetical protein ACHAWF_014608 [Thalassiosira exigua]
MANLRRLLLPALQLAAVLSGGASGRNSTNSAFEPLDGEDDDAAYHLDPVNSVAVGPSCGAEGNQRVPNTMFTIGPSDVGYVVVSSTPKNLVSARSSDGELTLAWNDEVASTAFEGGVRIYVPPSDLKAVKVRGASTVQILDGFAAVRELDVGGASTVTADLRSLPESEALTVRAEGASTVDVGAKRVSPAIVTEVSTLNVECDRTESLTIQGASTVRISGDVGSGIVEGASTVTASGKAAPALDVHSASTLRVQDCSLVHVSGASSCDEGVFPVSVDLSEKPETLKGNAVCGSWGGGVCIGGDTPLFSCTEEKVVAARDVSVGDEVRALRTNSGERVCSDVYYVYRHKEPGLGVHIATSRGDSLTVSYDHIMYVGETFEDRQPVHSQNLVPGDKLVMTNSNYYYPEFDESKCIYGGDYPSHMVGGEDRYLFETSAECCAQHFQKVNNCPKDEDPDAASEHVEVVEVSTMGTDLVNVLTVDPHLEVQTENGDANIVISAHAVDHDAYGAIFAPIRYVYLAFGAPAVEYLKPMFDAVDCSFAKPALHALKSWSRA